MNWSQLKKRITGQLAESVRSRVNIGITRYANSYTMSRGWIRIDKEEVLNMSTVEYEHQLYCGARGGRIEHQIKRKELNERNVFSSYNFSDSLFRYLNLSIDNIIRSENPIIRAFGMLDSRIGKSRLKKMDVSVEHALVKRLYELRCDSERIDEVHASTDLTTCINRKSKTKDVCTENITLRVAQRLSNNNKMRNLNTLLLRIYSGKVNENELETEISKILFAGFKDSASSEILLNSLQFLMSKTKLCDDAAYVKAFIVMINDHGGWIRSLEEWKPPSHNRKKQFTSLARHLWARYDVPLFMDEAWLQGSAVHQQWYKDIGTGKNIRNSENLPFPFTKKMAHHFLSAPNHYPIAGALRWAQVQALGGGPETCGCTIGKPSG